MNNSTYNNNLVPNNTYIQRSRLERRKEFKESKEANIIHNEELLLEETQFGRQRPKRFRKTDTSTLMSSTNIDVDNLNSRKEFQKMNKNYQKLSSTPQKSAIKEYIERNRINYSLNYKTDLAFWVKEINKVINSNNNSTNCYCCCEPKLSGFAFCNNEECPMSPIYYKLPGNRGILPNPKKSYKKVMTVNMDLDFNMETMPQLKNNHPIPFQTPNEVKSESQTHLKEISNDKEIQSKSEINLEKLILGTELLNRNIVSLSDSSNWSNVSYKKRSDSTVTDSEMPTPELLAINSDVNIKEMNIGSGYFPDTLHLPPNQNQCFQISYGGMLN